MTQATTVEAADIQRILQQVKDGDHKAYQQIVDIYWDKIYNRVFGMLKTREDAEEITQDAFIKAHRGLENFRGDASFSTWLFQIANNLATNRYWYWIRRKRDLSISLEQNITDDGDMTLADTLAADVDDPAAITVIQELQTRIDVCLPELNRKHREILELRIKKHFSYEKIAQKLGISVGTVKSRIARARESLREKLEADFDEKTQVKSLNQSISRR
ncbi:MAG: sigma-70 family RNA polymerase sigma factor [Opitutales bacterium]|nr:sigma-70 family RNA polymerase sigma factor [Opitutales bacterium]